MNSKSLFSDEDQRSLTRSPSRNASSASRTPTRNTPTRILNTANLRQLTEKFVVIFDELPLNMLLLRNEESKLMEVMETHGKARFKGIKVGDVIIEMNGKRLEFGLHHDEFASLVSKSTFPLRFSLWRASVPSKRYIDTIISWNGGKVELVQKDDDNITDSSSSLNNKSSSIAKDTIVALTKPRNLIIENQGFVFCSEVVYASRTSSSFVSGDLIVGFMHIPLASNLDGNGLIELLHLKHGPEIYINIWRPSIQGRPTTIPKLVSPVKSPPSKRNKNGTTTTTTSSSITGSYNSRSSTDAGGGGLEGLAAEAPLSLSSMMNMMGSYGTDTVSLIGNMATTTVEVIATTATGSTTSLSSPPNQQSGGHHDVYQVPNLFKRRMHYSEDHVSDILYSRASDKSPWIFEQSVWCGGVECEWHEDLDNTDEPISPCASHLSQEFEESPRRSRSSSFHTLSPKPVKRRSRQDTSLSSSSLFPASLENHLNNHSDFNVIDVTILVTEVSIFFIHQGLLGQSYQIALKLLPDMLLDIALPYYTVIVNGDEVAVRSSEVQLRLKESALSALEKDSASQWHLNPSLTSTSTSGASSSSTSSSSSDPPPAPPWCNATNGNKSSNSSGDRGGGGSSGGVNQQSLILCTASNMHRAELLETITEWYEHATGESLCVEQVPYLGSPPPSKPLLNTSSSLLANLSTNQQHAYMSTSVSSERPSMCDSVTSESQSRGDSVQSFDSQLADELGSMTLSSTRLPSSMINNTSVPVLSNPPPKAKRSSMFGLFKKKDSKSNIKN